MNKSLAEVKKSYPADKVHLLLPTVFEEQLNPFHKLSIMEVKADLGPNSGDVFKVGTQKINDAWVEFYSPSKPLLMKIATAAGIQFNPDYTGVTSPAKNCYVGRAHGAIKLPDGTWKTHFDEKMINLDDEEDKFRLEFMDKSIEGIRGKAATEAAKLFAGKWVEVDAKHGRPGDRERAFVINDADRQKYIDRSMLVNMMLLRSNAPQKALTGAILRVVRALIGMKGQYTKDELNKPFVLARVNFAPDFSDPEVRKAMLEHGLNAMGNVFGAAAKPTPPASLSSGSSLPDYSAAVENDPFISDSAVIIDEEPPVQDASHIPPQDDSPLPWDDEGDADDQGLEPACSGCGVVITQKVYDYSLKRNGRPLCYNCQKGAAQ